MTISPSQSTLKVSVLVPPSLILQQTQYVVVSIESNSDTIRNGHFVIRAPRGLFKSPTSVNPNNTNSNEQDEETQKKEADNTQSLTLFKSSTTSPNPTPVSIKYQMTNKGVILHLPDCERNEKLDFSLPLAADGITNKNFEVFNAKLSLR